MKIGLNFWTTVIVAFILISTNIYSQLWIGQTDTISNKNEETNFISIQKSFNEFWTDKNVGRKTPKNLRGGWKQFKRYEWFWEPRTYPDGDFPNPMHTYYELQKLRSRKKTDFDKTQSSNWSSIGPKYNLGGEDGLGRINCVVENPNYDGINNRTIWVGSASGGLWKSTDDGGTWNSTTDNLPTLGISSICINPNNTNIIYIATGDGDFNDTYSVGVLKSTDGGVTWNTTGLSWSIQNNAAITKMIMHPTNYAILYASTKYGLYKTIDAGLNWSKLNIPFSINSKLWDVDINESSPNVLYATSSNEIAKSTDNGNNWTILSNGLPNFDSDIFRVEMAVSQSSPDYLYAIYGYWDEDNRNNDYNSGMFGFYKSTNGGSNWSQILYWNDDYPNLLGWEADGMDKGGQAFYDLEITVSPHNRNYVYVGGINIWRTTNGGNNWSCIAHWSGDNGLPTVHADHHELVFASNSSRLYSGHDGGVSRSSDYGNTWNWIGSGLAITQFYRMSSAQTTQNLHIGGAQDNGTKLIENSIWEDIMDGDGMECIIDYSNENHIWGSYQNGEFTYSSDKGATFQDLPKPDDVGGWVTPLTINPLNPLIIFAGYTNVWKSTNRGFNWTKISSFGDDMSLTVLSVAHSNPNFIYAGTKGALRLTTNGGSTWTSISLPTQQALTSITIHKDSPNVIWATFSGYSNGNKVFLSTNRGVNWSNISGTLPNIPINCSIFQKDFNNRVYVGTDLGMFYRDNNTSDWVEFNDGLPNVIVNDIEIQDSYGWIYVASYGRGIWKAKLPGSIILPDSPDLISPMDNSITVIEGTEFDWNAVDNADSYQIQFSLNSSFDEIYYQKNINVNSLVLNSGILSGLTNYYWRVRAALEGSYGEYSSVWGFTTARNVPLEWTYKSNTNKSSTIRIPKGIIPNIGYRDLIKGDAIGIFYKDLLIEKCAGYAIWNDNDLDIVVWGDDILSPEKDGFADNETYDFKLWDSQLDRIYVGKVEYQSGSDKFSDNGLSVLSSLTSSYKFQTIELGKGWNMISSNIYAYSNSMEEVFKNIVSDLTLAKNGLGLTYIPQFDINNIGNWAIHDAYQVHTTKATNLIIGGIESIPNQESMILSAGWRMVAYLRNSPMNINTALESLTQHNKLLLAKNNNGQTFIPLYDINDIGNMLPGQGYQLYLLSSGELKYPSNDFNKSPTTNYFTTSHEAITLKNSISKTKSNMTLILQAPELNSNHEIAVINEKGQIVGSAAIIDNRTVVCVWEIESSTDDGVESTPYSLFVKVFDKVSGIFSDARLDKIQDLLTGKIINELCYEKDAFYLINIGLDSNDDENEKVSVAPNPTNNECTVIITLQDLSLCSITIYNLSGTEIYKSDNLELPAGINKYEIQLSDFSVGEYNIVVKIGKKIMTEKLIIIR